MTEAESFSRALAQAIDDRDEGKVSELCRAVGSSLSSCWWLSRLTEVTSEAKAAMRKAHPFLCEQDFAEGMSPLMRATLTGSVRMIDSLLEEGAFVNHRTPLTGDSALVWAMHGANQSEGEEMRKFMHIVKRLVRAGASCEALRNPDGGYSQCAHCVFALLPEIIDEETRAFNFWFHKSQSVKTHKWRVDCLLAESCAAVLDNMGSIPERADFCIETLGMFIRSFDDLGETIFSALQMAGDLTTLCPRVKSYMKAWTVELDGYSIDDPQHDDVRVISFLGKEDLRRAQETCFNYTPIHVALDIALPRRDMINLVQRETYFPRMMYSQSVERYINHTQWYLEHLRKDEPWRRAWLSDSGPDRDTVRFFRELRKQWRPTRHKWYSEGHKKAVAAVLQCAHRLKQNPGLPMLPDELWLRVMEWFEHGWWPFVRNI